MTTEEFKTKLKAMREADRSAEAFYWQVSHKAASSCKDDADAIEREIIAAFEAKPTTKGGVYINGEGHTL